MKEIEVWVVHYVSFFDGDFSNAGVKGIFNSEKVAHKVAEEMRKDPSKEVYVKKFKVETGA